VAGIPATALRCAGQQHFTGQKGPNQTSFGAPHEYATAPVRLPTGGLAGQDWDRDQRQSGGVCSSQGVLAVRWPRWPGPV